MTLFVAGKKIGANKPLCTTGDITAKDFFWVVVQLMALQMLGARVYLVASWKLAAESLGCPLAARALVCARAAILSRVGGHLNSQRKSSNPRRKWGSGERLGDARG